MLHYILPHTIMLFSLTKYFLLSQDRDATFPVFKTCLGSQMNVLYVNDTQRNDFSGLLLS